MSCSKNVKNSKNDVVKKPENWIEYKTKDSIPDLLNSVLKEINKKDSNIADFNGEYEETDVISNDTLPRKQIRFLARKNTDWRLSYIQGGFAKHYVYIECKIDKDSIYDFKLANTIFKLENNDTIDKLLNDKKIKLSEIKIRRE